ncbi:MAG: ScyD/ScyE family protein [Acidimicrobiia bacterium]
MNYTRRSQLRSVSYLAIIAAGLLVAAAWVAPVTADQHLATTEVIVPGGLNNPRGIAIGPHGSLFVAESGAGGPVAVSNEEGFTVCIGDTGSVARIRAGTVDRVAMFASYADSADPDGPGPAPGTCEGDDAGVAAVGPAGVEIDSAGRIGVTIGLGGDLAFRSALPATAAAQLGTMARVEHDGSVMVISDLAGFEETYDPDGNGADSNPYGLTTTHHGRWIAVDAGGNDILEIESSGVIRRYVSSFPPLAPAPFTPPSCFADLPPEVQANFPPPGAMIPQDSVPTSVAVGPDGAYYVGLLSGFPFAPGTAAVYRIDPATGRFDPFVTGLSHVIDVEFGPDGSLYILQLTDGGLLEGEVCNMAAPGSLLRVMDGVKTVLADDLILPGGLAVDAYGSAYVTTFSILPGAGGVVKITPTLEQGNGWG